MVKKTIAFFGTRPFFLISSGSTRTSALSSNAANELKSLNAWLASVLRSARNRIRGRRDGSRLIVPPSLEQLPRNLKRNRRLAGACREREQNAIVAFRHFLQNALDRN